MAERSYELMVDDLARLADLANANRDQLFARIRRLGERYAKRVLCVASTCLRCCPAPAFRSRVGFIDELPGATVVRRPSHARNWHSPEPVPTNGPPEVVPLAVWPCAQTSAQYQRAGRYLPASTSHPGKMLPELARRLVAEYCPPGGLVADPMCGIGTTLVEAAAVGRQAVGVELESRWAELARANLDHGLPADQASLAEVRVGDARQLPELLADLAGRGRPGGHLSALCVRYRGDRQARVAGRAAAVSKTSLNYSRDPANLGRARGEGWRAGIAGVLAGCAQVLRPVGC